jgi:hypothetical protein
MASPVDSVVRGARAYTQAAGLNVPEANYSRSLITEPASQKIAGAYDRLPEFDSGALPAYHAMREETMRQFDHMTGPRSKGGMGVDVEVTKHDPYGSQGVNSIVPEFRNDVVNNNRVKVLSTASTGGHPVFSNDENDAFRAVHDVFGHLGSGRGIDFDGEEAAYQKHSRMFSPLARQAMATETRGQNSALRMHGSFQDQKVGLLPAHMQGLQFSRIGGPAALAAAAKRAGEKSRAQGLT